MEMVIIVCVLIQVYLITAGYSVEDIYRQFGINSYLVFEDKQYYRIITGSFVHANLLHLTMNMMSLYYLSSMLKYVVDDITMFTIYVISLITSALASTYFDPMSISVGSSGAVYGLFGVIIAFALLKKKYDNGRMIKAIIPVAILNIMISLMPGVNMVAHLSGLLSGAFIYYIYANDKIKVKQGYYYIIPSIFLILNLL